MKLTSDSRCLRRTTKSNQLSYGASAKSPLAANSCRRTGLSARDAFASATCDVEHGEVERQAEERLRTASVTNSSISFPTWRVMPWKTAPAA